MTVPDDCPRFLGWGYRGAAEDFVAAVEDRALARGDAERRVVENDPVVLEDARERLSTVADLDLAAHRRGRTSIHPARGRDGKSLSRGFFARSDHDSLTRCVEGGDV